MINDERQRQGAVCRSDRFPLKPGDTFTLFERRIYGAFCESPEATIPGTYEIVDAVGVDGRLLHIYRTGWNASQFFCSAENVHEILLNSYCNYQRGES